MAYFEQLFRAGTSAAEGEPRPDPREPPFRRHATSRDVKCLLEYGIVRSIACSHSGCMDSWIGGDRCG